MMEGPVAMGVFVREGQSPGLLSAGRVLLVADSRVDGTVPGSEAAGMGESGLPLLESVIQRLGPAGLEGVAADFALARYDARRGELLLSRSALNFRPLYWARRAERIGFACDPAILVGLGLASGELDRDAISAFLLGGIVDENTGFMGIRRLLGGWWARFRTDGRASTGRWFRPERVPERQMSLGGAVERTREAVLEATRSRAEGERVAHMLSAGRDSGTVAAAMGELGIRATCLTYRFDAAAVTYEGSEARNLASAMGHDWREVPVSRHVTPAQLAELPQMTGTPLGHPVPPTMFALRDAVADTEATVLFDGQGGEPLFTATPVAVLDLLKRGRPGLALRAAQGFDRWWFEPYALTFRWVSRAIAPAWLMQIRERARRVPPWLSPPPGGPPPRPFSSARDYVVRSLIGVDSDIEFLERTMQTIGVGYASPLLDMRVIRCAMEIPLELKVPVVEPKLVLARAFLGGLASTRLKAPQTAYFSTLAEAMRVDFPDWLGPGSMSAQNGYVLGRGFAATGETMWLGQYLRLVPVEAWLRAEGEDRRGD